MAPRFRSGTCRLLSAAALFVILAHAGCGSDDNRPRPDTTPPAAVDDLTATSWNDSSIYVAWTTSGDDGETGRAAAFDLRYSTAPIAAAGFDTAKILALAFGPQEPGSRQGVIVDSLDEATVYYFALRTADEVPNWSPVSNVAFAKTGWDSIPPAAITTLRVSRATRTSALLTWKAPVENAPPGRAVSYEIRYATDWITDETWPSAIPATPARNPGEPGAPDSLEITGLEPQTLYYFAVRSLDVRGNISALSDIAYTRTIRLPIAWTVRQDGSGDVTTIQAGLDSALAGDTVRVGPGVYFETIVFRGPDITLASEAGWTSTIIDGMKKGSVVTVRSGETGETVIEGFTIRNGIGSPLVAGAAGHYGGGILILDAAPTIRGNVIRDNGNTNPSGDLTVSGGGLYFKAQAPGLAPEIVGNIVELNRSVTNGAGIGVQGPIAPWIHGNVVRLNSMEAEGDGGGAWLFSVASGTRIQDNQIDGNIAGSRGGGLSVRGAGGDIEISNNVIYNNLARALTVAGADDRGGGGLHLAGPANFHVANNTFAGNSASDSEAGLGGAIALDDGTSVTIERNIIAFTQLNGGIFCLGPSFDAARIRNNLAWSNGGGDGTGSCGSWAAGNGNIVADPLFCDFPHGNVGTAAGSPALSHPAGYLGAYSEPGCSGSVAPRHPPR